MSRPQRVHILHDVNSARTLIAIVDDEEPVSVALTRLMLSFGFRVTAFSSGAEFLDSLNSSRPDCVVLDLHMPGMSGFDVMAKLRSAGDTLPLVVITGHDTPETEMRVYREGAVAYLRKPIDGHDLLVAVTAAVGSRGEYRNELAP